MTSVHQAFAYFDVVFRVAVLFFMDLSSLFYGVAAALLGFMVFDLDPLDVFFDIFWLMCFGLIVVLLLFFVQSPCIVCTQPFCRLTLSSHCTF